MKAQHPTPVTQLDDQSGVIQTPARVVYSQAPVQLGRLVSLEDSADAVVEIGGAAVQCEIDPSVDPALLQESLRTKARVLIENGNKPLVVGVVATQRSLNIDRDGRVIADLTTLSVRVKEEVVLRTREAFLRVKGREVESYAGEIITRARDTVRVLVALIRMN